MCTTRSWKNIEFQGGTAFVSLIATRSDNLLMRVYHPIWPEATPADIVNAIINKLESMRNCKCSQIAPCDQHK